ncbi:inactive tyrosine-protein kinase RYK-like [Drosophila pseudoobscura]|uniref:Inactive tyrosine-protein kinase RYK-like n=1 Tax=Drosophila pseudoobscura pseudoobscura TaxID=46245 RepID=A0A6I8VQW8_DROPS|nr:inactive tyrosine-protein kinase RYK-like [Drosophila pseudoobscura]
MEKWLDSEDATKNVHAPPLASRLFLAFPFDIAPEMFDLTARTRGLQMHAEPRMRNAMAMAMAMGGQCGLEADLFYVHEGSINTYAMHFTVPVPADVHELEFSWQSLIAYPLPYAISIEYANDQDALGTPTLSIPHKGLVPQEIESFLVYLPCTGNASLQLPVNVNMVVRGPPRFNDTRLHFKRNKICAKGISPEPNQSPAPAHAPSQGPALLSAAACAVGLVLAVGLVASMMYLRARKQLRQDSLHTSFTTAAYGSHQNVFIRLDPLGRPPSATGSYATIASLNKYPGETKKSCSIFDRFRSSPIPTPYATALLPMGDQTQAGETIYSKPESICPSRISYYASSQLTLTQPPLTAL